MQMSFVRRVLRNPFSLSSTSVTESTSIELESAAAGKETCSFSAAALEPAPLSDAPLSDVRMEGFGSDAEALMNSEVLLGFLMREKRETVRGHCWER